MAKRSREDFEPLSVESKGTGESATARSIIHPRSSSKILRLGPVSSVAPTLEMQCSLPPHRQALAFGSFEEYEIHYAKAHTNRCIECRRNFPTEHFLDLHIAENHDALFCVRKERGEKMYSCFVEGCDRSCLTPQKRRMHLIDKHMFPKDYDFFVVNDGIDRRSSMLRSGKHRKRRSAAHHLAEIEGRTQRRNSIKESTASEQENLRKERMDSSSDSVVADTPRISNEDTDIDGLSAAMSALRFVPPSIRFGGRGRGRGRGGFSQS